MIFISNAAARFTTSRPMLPRPTMPSVLPRSSVPMNFRFSHLPDLVDALARGMERASDNVSARVCSATETALPPGVFITRTPAAVAAGSSMLSTPTPARPITRSFGAAESIPPFTITALRTINASAFARCWEYSFGFDTTTSHPGCCSRSFTAALSSGSAMRISMSRWLGRGWSNRGCFFRQRGFCVYVLYRRHAGPEFHWNSVGRQNDFEFRDHSKQIRKVEIAQVRDAENLPLHRSLTVGDDGPEAIPKFLHDHFGIHTLRRFHCRYRGPRRMRDKQFQTQRRNGRASGLSQHLRVRHQLVHSYGFDVLQRFRQRQQQRSGRCPTGFAVRRILLFLLEIEIIARRLGVLRKCPRLGTDGEKRETGRNHESFLRSADHYVQAPAIDIQRHGAEPGDCIHNENRFRFFDGLTHRTHVVRRARGTLGRLHKHASRVRFRLQRLDDALRAYHSAIGF